MKAKIYITIEDDTSEEQLIAAGGSREKMREIFHESFQMMLDAVTSPGRRADLRVVVEDNTKDDEEGQNHGPTS